MNTPNVKEMAEKLIDLPIILIREVCGSADRKLLRRRIINLIAYTLDYGNVTTGFIIGKIIKLVV